MNQRTRHRARPIGPRAAKAGLAVAAGALLPLAFAPFDLFFAAPLCYAALFVVWRDETPAGAFRFGLLFGLASFFAGVHWVYVSLHEYGRLHPVIAWTMTGLFVSVLALFPALTGLLAAWLRSTSGAVAWLVALPALFVLTEWLRGWIFTGFGWLSAGYSQTESWLFAFAPIGGLHAMSWAVLLTAGALAAVTLGARRERMIAVGALAALWGSAYALDRIRFTAPKDDSISVALVQGAVPQDLKWLAEHFNETLRLYRNLTEQSAGAELIVWPEAAIPTFYDDIRDYLAEIEDIAAERGGSVVLGVLTGSIEDFQNAVVALTEPRQFYVKRHLVPFGEYFPVPDFVREWLRLMSLPYIDARPGADEQPPLDVAGERLAVTICYEAVFGAEQLHYLPDATLLVNVSNDAWFGDSIGPHQHLQIARVRAAEAGRYMLRAANTGITAVIDPRGRVVSRIPQFEPGVLTDVVRGFTGATPYAVVGNYPVMIGAFLVLLLSHARSLAARLGRGAA